MELQFWAATDPGRVRELNEDSYLVDRRLRLFIVCDGMGGHAAGEVASAVCARTVRQVVSDHRDVLDQYDQDPDNPRRRRAICNLLEMAVQEACARIYDAAQADEERQGMGTTCVALIVRGARGFVAHVGDSRLYLHRQGRAVQVTEDHSLFNELIRQGRARADEPFPHKNAVTRAVGVKRFVEVDTFDMTVLPDDRLLLCSDGLCEYFEEEAQVEEILGGQIASVADRSIEFALASGGKDNITAVVVEAYGEAEAGAEQVAEVQAALDKVRLFDALNFHERLEVAATLVRLRELPRDTVIMSEGERGPGLFAVVRGSVAATRRGQTLAICEPGDFFGLLSLFDQPETAGYEVLAPSEVIEIQRAAFLDFVRHRPDIGVKLYRGLVGRWVDERQRMPVELQLNPALWQSVVLEDPGDQTPASGTHVDASIPPERPTLPSIPQGLSEGTEPPPVPGARRGAEDNGAPPPVPGGGEGRSAEAASPPKPPEPPSDATRPIDRQRVKRVRNGGAGGAIVGESQTEDVASAKVIKKQRPKSDDEK